MKEKKEEEKHEAIINDQRAIKPRYFLLLNFEITLIESASFLCSTRKHRNQFSSPPGVGNLSTEGLAARDKITRFQAYPFSLLPLTLTLTPAPAGIFSSSVSREGALKIFK